MFVGGRVVVVVVVVVVTAATAVLLPGEQPINREMTNNETVAPLVAAIIFPSRLWLVS